MSYKNYAFRMMCGAVIIFMLLWSVPQQVFTQEEEELTPVEQVALKVKDMESKITAATKTLKEVTDVKKQHEELEKLITMAQEASDQLTEEKEMFQTLSVAIETTSKLRDEIQSKSQDKDVDGGTREEYAKMAQDLDKEIATLYDRKLLITDKREELQQTIKTMKIKSEFIAYALAAKRVKQANEALSKVLESVENLNQSFLDFAEKIGVDVTNDSATTPTDS